MVALTPAQERNLRAALEVTNDPAMRVRLAFAVWTESRALITANGGLNTSHSPGFDTHPQWPAILRRSLELPHDAVGNNGRSTGMLQQISDDVGGGWGSMAGTMDPATSARRFLAALRVTDNPIYAGWLLTPTGREWVKVELSDPIAADVLRVQQPLANEARSSNYDASQVTVARAIVAQLFPPSNDWIIDMADQAALDKYRGEIVRDLKDGDGHSGRDLAERTDHLEGSIAQIASTVNDLHNRILTPGAPWDNVQDMQATLKSLVEAVASLTAKVDALAPKA